MDKKEIVFSMYEMAKNSVVRYQIRLMHISGEQYLSGIGGLEYKSPDQYEVKLTK